MLSAMYLPFMNLDCLSLTILSITELSLEARILEMILQMKLIRIIGWNSETSIVVFFFFLAIPAI